LPSRAAGQRFANPEADGGFTLYANPNRNQVKYRVTPEMLRAANKCVRTGALRLRGEIDPIRIDSRIGGGMNSPEFMSYPVNYAILQHVLT
jgi:hypothetical protein